jgi:SAM-dependent MidA family methyltransferase
MRYAASRERMQENGALEYSANCREDAAPVPADHADPLAALIRAEIARAGPLTFARFMELALYHPTLGYYAGGGTGHEPIGWEGDYVTSGDVHPLWGWCLARQLHEMWELLGAPPCFQVVEVGGARGLLARDVLAYAREHAPDWRAALRYTLVERAPATAPLQRERAAALARALAASGLEPDAVTWSAGIEALAPASVVGCIVANEVADALPVHLVEARGGALAEIYVGAVGDHLVERAGPPSSDAVAGDLDRFSIPWRAFPAGWRAEVCLAADGWMRGLGRALARGFVLALDYGDLARHLYTRDRRHGTLAVYTRHRLGERPLAAPGRQDLTAHVNFSALIAAGRAAGLRLAGLTTQRAFLLRAGIVDEAERRAAEQFPLADPARATDAGQRDYLRRAALRAAVRTLTSAEGLGGFRVLALQRGVPGAGRRLSGLASAPDEA